MRTSECGQSQPPRRGVRCTGEPLFWLHCHSRGTQRRPRLMWWLRTELWTALFSRSRALGPMLPPSAWELWPFSCVQHAQPGGRMLWCVVASGSEHFEFPVQNVLHNHIVHILPGAAGLRGAWLTGTSRACEPWRAGVRISELTIARSVRFSFREIGALWHWQLINLRCVKSYHDAVTCYHGDHCL